LWHSSARALKARTEIDLRLQTGAIPANMTVTEAVLGIIKIRKASHGYRRSYSILSADTLLIKLPGDFSDCAILDRCLVLGSDTQKILHLRIDARTLQSASCNFEPLFSVENITCFKRWESASK